MRFALYKYTHVLPTTIRGVKGVRPVALDTGTSDSWLLESIEISVLVGEPGCRVPRVRIIGEVRPSLLMGPHWRVAFLPLLLRG